MGKKRVVLFVVGFFTITFLITKDLIIEGFIFESILLGVFLLLFSGPFAFLLLTPKTLDSLFEIDIHRHRYIQIDDNGTILEQDSTLEPPRNLTPLRRKK